ncbi:MAG: CpaF family protein [Lachnospiraceae bacterium]
MTDNLFNSMREQVVSRLDVTRDIPGEEIITIIEAVLSDFKRSNGISIEQREEYRTRLFNSIRRLDILQELIDDDEISEIMVNGTKGIFVEKNGSLIRWDKELDSQKVLEDIAHKIAAGSNRMVNQANPIVDTRLADGSRVNIVMPPAAIEGPIITIRKFYQEPITIEKLIELGSITQQAARFLKQAVERRCNIFVSGGTGSGKTTFLNALSNFIPKAERIITIEDAAELQIQGVDNLVRLETRNANMEGDNAITIRDLIKSSLRMRPDRIIVGEIRGAEAIDMLQAMNTGHDGSLSTGHANTPGDMLHRIETMVLMGMEIPLMAVRGQISSAIDIVVHLSRRSDKSRKVTQIVEVGDLKEGDYVQNVIFNLENRDGTERLEQKSCIKFCRKLI